MGFVIRTIGITRAAQEIVMASIVHHVKQVT
jgi:hypothetical protein